jgi:hypothetical protein
VGKNPGYGRVDRGTDSRLLSGKVDERNHGAR